MTMRAGEGWDTLRRIASWLLLSSGLVFAPAAHAQRSSQLALDWRAPDGCPTRDRAQAALDTWLGEQAPSAEATAVKVEIVQRASGFEAAIEFSGQVRGERQLAAANCASLSDAVVLIVAITVDPLTVSQRLSAPPSAPAAPPPAARDASPGATSGELARVTLALQLSVDWGSLPQLSLGAGAQVGLTLGRLGLALEGSFWLQRLQRLESGNAAGGEIGLWEGRARGCYDLLHGANLAVGPCAAFAFGLMSGEGVELVHPNPTTQLAPWALGLLGAHIRQRSHPLFVDAGLELGLSILRPVYEIDKMPVFQPSAAVVRAWLGIGWSL
jgi:hypothetical protein